MNLGQSTIGKATAKAASAGDLNLLIAPTTGAGLLGLARLVAADGNGKDFGDGDGAQFLADLTTKLSDETANLPFNGPTDVYDAALSQALTAATQDGTAARLALSGDGGLKLATQLLEGSAPITETVGAYYTTMNQNEGPHLAIDPNTIAGFLNAAILAKTPGSDSASQQGMQAALNVVRATAAFSSWDPSNNEHIYTVGPLPDPIRGALYNYGNAYPFDLAQSAADSHTDGVVPPTVGPGAGPIGRFFDTTHAAQATIDDMNANISLMDLARLRVTQGAVESKVPDLSTNPGIVDPATDKVVYGPAFQSWWGSGENTTLGPINPKNGEPVAGSKSLETYANQIQNAFGLHP